MPTTLHSFLRRHAVAGFVAGLTTVVALHPLDVIKTRMQGKQSLSTGVLSCSLTVVFSVQDGAGGLLPKYKGTVHCVRTIWSREGLPGLYVGLTPCVIASSTALCTNNSNEFDTSGLSWSLYFMFYNRSKSSWRQRSGKTELTPVQHLWSGLEAGVLATVLTNPIWVLKTRFQLQEAPRIIGGNLQKTQYRNLRQAISTIARKEGIRGFYRGLGPSLLLCTNPAIQFAIYEELRRIVVYLNKSTKSRIKSSEKLTSGAAFFIGGASKVTASIVTYPTQVMRSRIQQRFDIGRRLKYTSLRNAFVTTFQREGVRGLYKGLVPSFIRVVPQASLMFMVYEKIVQLLTPVKIGRIWNQVK
eukprot:g7240.t1